MNLVHSAQRKTEGFEREGGETITRKKENVSRREARKRENPQIIGGFRAMPYASYLQEILFEGVGNGRGERIRTSDFHVPNVTL